MGKMWAGRTSGDTAKIADEFNSSIGIDSKMFKEDITGSIAHAEMLSFCNIISVKDKESIVNGLQEILADIESGKLKIDMNAEDIHMFVETVLTEKIGDMGKKLHTARSRNDQVALDLRMYLKNKNIEIQNNIKNLVKIITVLAEENIDAVMPGYTHLQRAQPILFSHQILSYAFMLLRDLERLKECYKRTDVSPIGACALAGTTYNTDRKFEAELLGFNSVSLNSIDSVSDRDFCVEILSDISLIMVHLSRFCEELILWSSSEFNFIKISDAYTTGSSIMPQKKNPDMAELVRGKTGRTFGNLITMLTILKGLPLAYNKDLQEDKETVFDSVDTVNKCLNIFASMLKDITVNKESMLNASKTGFINATDLADYLVKKGIPFRTAYKLCGNIIAYCIKNNTVLEDLPLKTYKEFSDKFEEDVFKAIDLKTCVENRISFGGTSKQSVIKQIEYIKKIV